MSKASNRAAASKAKYAKDAKLDTYDPIDPGKRVIHESNDKDEGTGPVSFDGFDEETKRYMAAKHILANGGPVPGMSPYGLVHAKKKDEQIVQQRIREIEYAHKDEWISKHVDWTNPASIQVWRQAAPDFWERRVEYLRKTIDIQGRLAMIVTKGFPTTPEEVELLYLVDTGQLKIEDKGPHMVAVETPSGGIREIKRGWLHNLFTGWNAPTNKTHAELITGLRHPTNPGSPSGLVFNPRYSRGVLSGQDGDYA